MSVLANESLVQEAQSISDWIINLRRKFHRTPELMYEEVETSRLVRETLDELQVSYQAGIAETGTLAQIGTGEGPCVALRADMDALPIHEEADVPFRSMVDGKMHACGHDCHTAMLLGAARLLKEREPRLAGTVKLLFQPAEEGGAGGQRMCEEGVLDSPSVQRIFGLHVWPLIETGYAASRAGTFMAATTFFEITIKGSGGHAAMPHMTVDPVTTAARVITDLQSIISREVSPLSPAVLSVTRIEGGSANNVIPSSVELGGTIRALTSVELESLKARLTAITESVAATHRCTADVRFPGIDYPALRNDEHCWLQARAVAEALLGERKVLESEPVMGGEDFAFFTDRIPGVFVGLGVGNPSIGARYGVHHSMFKVDERALPLGTALHVGFALSTLRELG